MLIALLGPTAVGKTKISIQIAQKLEAEIISLDSRQIYKYLDIGTAKPTQAEQALVRHHLIDVVEPTEDFTAADYQKLAAEAIKDIQNRGKIPLIVGGCGMYFRALVDGLFEGPSADSQIRAELRAEAEQKGSTYLYQRLCEIDPQYAAKIHPNDLIRIIRALEVHMKSGRPISQLQKQWEANQPRYNFIAFGLERNRQELYNEINQRLEIMIEAGLIDEVKSLLNRGYSKNLKPLQSFGYKEIIAHLEGQYDLLTAVDLIKQNTRRFAKRQLTWFKADQRVKWINLSEGESALQFLYKCLKLKKHL
jgi:tRNA dimethylallyltransferase